MPPSVQLSDPDLAKIWAQDPDLIRHVTHWSWFKPAAVLAIEHSLAHLAPGTAPVDHHKLAAAFYDWAPSTAHAVGKYGAAAPSDVAHHVFGELLRNLLKARCIASSAQAPSTPGHATSLWSSHPDVWAGFRLCATLLEARLLQLQTTLSFAPDAFEQGAVLSFLENAHSGDLVVNNFFDVFVGAPTVLQPHWTIEDRPAILQARQHTGR